MAIHRREREASAFDECVKSCKSDSRYVESFRKETLLLAAARFQCATCPEPIPHQAAPRFCQVGPDLMSSL
jgi:hypothetical protein